MTSGEGRGGFVARHRTGMLYLLSLLVGLLLWELVAGQFSRIVLSPPSAVARHLFLHTRSLLLPSLLAQSLGHAAVGYLLATAVAVPLGFLMGRSEIAFHMFDPVVNALYAIPTLAFVPFLIIWFGLFFESRAALVFLMCVFDMLVAIAAGARNVDPALVNVGRSFAASRWQVATKVLLPASLPFVFTALRIGLVRAVNGMITAELFFAAVNLGAYMQQAQNRFDSAGLLAVLTILCLLGLAVQEGIRGLEARVVPWHVRQ
jgi:NitT/TauT family transport system permease protein/sulfonate transport system permease protein